MSVSDAISIISIILGAFIALIGTIVTLYKWNIEKTIKSQSELTNQKIDLTHQMIQQTIHEIREDNKDVKEIAISAHHSIETHVLNYHRREA